MNIQEQEDRDFHYSTDAEWDREEARLLGMADPERAWVCTGRDSWYPNPYYKGPPVPHPEEYPDYDEDRMGPHRPYSALRDGDDEIPF